MSILDIFAGKMSANPECREKGHDWEKLPEEWDGYDPITLKCQRGCGAEFTAVGEDGNDD